jgi:ABC-2 type transport system ATP-binding protein
MIIQTKGLTKYYGKVRGVEDLNLEVNEGEIFGYLGPNGAGKTTTIRVLLDLIRPTQGSATIFGLDTRQHSVEIRKRIGNLPGEVALYENMSGQELLDLMGRLHGGDLSARRRQLVDRLEIDLSRPIRTLSHGMKQKVAIIQAFQHDPELIILDEPTTGLDPLIQQEFYRLLREEKARGKTIFMSSHILPEVERVCDRVGIVREGRLVDVEDVDDLKRKAVRRMEVTFASKVDPSELIMDGVELIREENHTMELAVHGHIDALIKKVATFPIEDLVFSEGSLEETFMRFYGRENAE